MRTALVSAFSFRALANNLYVSFPASGAPAFYGSEWSRSGFCQIPMLVPVAGSSVDIGLDGSPSAHRA